MDEVLNNNTGENPAVEQWQDMDIRAQAQGETPPEIPNEPAETNPAPIGETTSESDAPQVEDEATDQPGEAPNEASEQDDSLKPTGEQANQTAERKQSRAEKRLETYEKRLNEIELELHNASIDKAELEESLDSIEWAIEKNAKETEGLSTKAEQLERQLKKCRRGFFSRIGGLFKEAANLRFNLSSKPDYAKRQEALEAALRQNQEEKETTESLDETREQLSASEVEGEELNEERADTVDQIHYINNKTVRLNNEKAKLEREIEELREIVYNEGFEEAIADAKDGRSSGSAIRLQEREKKAQNKYFDEQTELVSIDRKKQEARARWDNSPGIMATIGRENESSERAKANIEAARSEVIGEIDSRINILRNVAETESVKGSLLRLKEKIMRRLRGLA